jgi:deoxyribonuclease V
MIPSLKKSIEKGLLDERSLLVLDGNGYLHPRRMGIACQIGAVTGMMTCGVAKKLMCGRIGKWEKYSIGEIAEVRDGDDLLGFASRNKNGAPIYISRGNRVDVEKVVEILVELKKGRFPEPIRAAHDLANRFRRSESPSCDLEILSLPLHE